MRKLALIASLTLLLFATTVPAAAQIKFGVKGGLNLTGTPAEAWKSISDTDNYTGYFIGPMLEFKVPLIGIGMDAAVMYADKGYKIDNKKQTGVEIPLHLKYSIGLGDLAGVYLVAGPSFFFTSSKVTDKASYKKSQTALDLGFGVKLFGHLQAGLNYYIPLTDVAVSDIVKGDGFKNKTWQVSIAYLF
ncbi:MAG: porin family protein [Prevotellaceae bacterium]|jgi:hypothetical protein|nr:porin family protein [Prevotellaceae bacterium]